MADKQVAKTIELNDGIRMPVLGLGTLKVWKFQYSLLGNPYHFKENQDLITFNNDNFFFFKTNCVHKLCKTIVYKKLKLNLEGSLNTMFWISR